MYICVHVYGCSVFLLTNRKSLNLYSRTFALILYISFTGKKTSSEKLLKKEKLKKELVFVLVKENEPAVAVVSKLLQLELVETTAQGQNL